jgi:SecD/SecF fusion protein
MVAIGTNDMSKYFPGVKAATPQDYNKAVLNRVQREARGKIKLGLDLQGGTSFLVGMDTTKLDTNSAAIDRQAVLEQAIEVLRKRVDRFGVAEPVLLPQGENRILIQLPGLSEAEFETARQTIQRAAFLEFRLVHPESEQLIAQGLGAPGYERLLERRKDKNNQEYVVPWLVKRGSERGLTGEFVERATVSRNPLSNTPEILLRFNAAGSDKFAEITKAAVGRHLAIVLDGQLASAPVIREPITGGSASISGSYDIKEAFELANVLENPLQAPLKIEEERTVDPSLGKDSITSGVRASVIAAVLTFLFMITFYFLAGMVANVALFTNILITLGVMCSIGTTLTLPGIAGIALTIGMAVDANVLIFERIREELAKGKSLRSALSAGYDRAFGTIFDSHVTTLITSVVLMKLGTGPVQGFGVTLTIGVAASLFTALIVTRLIFDFMISRGIVKSIRMLPMVKFENVNFLGQAKVAIPLSILLIVAGMGYGIFGRGHDVLGVDFKGGDSIALRFKEKIGVDQIRASLDKNGVGEALIQYQKGVADPNELLNVLVAFDAGPKVQQALAKDFPQAGFTTAGVEKVGPSVGAEIQRSAIIASLISLLGVLIYVAFRYEFGFAVAAVIATLHDVLLTMGIFFISGRELSSPMVAAVLTIIGYSINDKIVILDRIREDLKLGIAGNFRQLINIALNQTMSRTLITGGAVILATLSLYLFGGGVINDFAFTFLVGILVGTYSSIYIAAPIVLRWYKGQRPSAAPARTSIDNSVGARV